MIESFSAVSSEESIFSTEIMFVNFARIRFLSFIKHSKTIPFSDAYIIYDNGTRLKLKEVQVEYIVTPPHTSSFSIDFKDIYAGVIEYLSNGKKTWIRKNGIIEER